MEATEEVFRVRVSLERFFSDSRARCFMGAARARPARWLTRRLRRAFPLPRALALLCRGHLLPPDEPLALLQPDDLLEVIPVGPSELVVRREKNTRAESGSASEEISVPRPPQDSTSVDDIDGAAAEVPPPSERSRSSSREGEGGGPGPGADELESGKRRALLLLSRLTGEGAPRRRRTRRRRRAPPALEPAAEETGVEKQCDGELTAMEVSSGELGGTQPGWQGSGPGEARAPRLVRALPTPLASLS